MSQPRLNSLRVFVGRPLASNFSILDGWITITVPDVETGVNYTIVREYTSVMHV